MATPRPARKSFAMSLDNALKILITIMLSLLGVMGNSLMRTVEKLEEKMGDVESSIVELKTDIKYLSAKSPTAAVRKPGPDPDVPSRLP